MELNTTPLWQEQAPVPQDLGRADLPEQADVAVVGGGYTGLGAARLLARFGASVVVLEQHQIGWGASSRNGGKALVGLKHDASHVVHQFGPEVGRALWQASLDGIDLLEETVAEESIECDFERCGSLFAAAKAKHFTKMCRETEWLRREFGYERIDVPRGELRSEIGTDAYHGGVVEPLSAGLHPAKYVVGLARAASRAGATLCGSTAVQAIESDNGGYTITSSQGVLRAKEVLMATNGYTGRQVPEVSRRVLSVGSYIIATEPLPEILQQQISPRGRMFYDSRWFLHYFRLTPDGRMLFGGRTTISPDQDLRKSAAILRDAMVAVFPALHDTPITHSWSGNLGVSFDALPHIGRVNGIHYASGYSGHGVALSATLAQHVAELMAGKRDRSVFMEIKHPTRFFYRGRPWFRPLLGVGLRIMDRLT